MSAEQSDQMGLGQRPPYKLFSLESVAIATLLGSFGGGAFLITTNHHRLDDEEKAIRSLVLGALLTLVYVIPLVLVEARLILLLWLFPPFVMYLVGMYSQGRELHDHTARGGEYESLFSAVMKGAGWGLFIFTFIFICRSLVFAIGGMLTVTDAPKKIDEGYEVPRILEKEKVLFVENEEEVEALLELGREFYNAENYEGAQSEFQKAADLGSMEAYYLLGMLSYYGLIGENDEKKAAELFEVAAFNNHAYAQFDLGIMYVQGVGVDVDYEKGWEWIVNSASGGYSVAQNFVGQSYYLGDFEGQDFEKARAWLLLAAQQGEQDAQVTLGMMYFQGQGVDLNKEKAHDWFMLAADAGHSFAYYQLGWMYHYGEGVQEDKEQAFEWFLRSAQSGEASAQTYLGQSYYYGEVVEQDYKLAKDWLSKASKNGSPPAQYTLGMMYSNGEGVKKSEDKALSYFYSAAQSGHGMALFELGRSYQGRDGEDSIVYAHMYTSLAYVFGVRHLEEEVLLIEERMSPEEIEKANKLAEEWIQKYRKEQLGF